MWMEDDQDQLEKEELEEAGGVWAGMANEGGGEAPVKIMQKKSGGRDDGHMGGLRRKWKHMRKEG